MNVLIWQWGRRGAGPRYAADLAEGMRSLPGVSAMLSLSRQAELLHSPTPPICELPFYTYDSLPAAVRRLLTAPFDVRALARRLRPLNLDLAICAMPAALDPVMSAALRRLRVPIAVILHDADKHPGDGFPLQMVLQRRLARQANVLVVLSRHVGERLTAQGLANSSNLVTTSHPPFAFGKMPPPPRAHGGKLRLLSFGRLLPYKGLDLLESAMRLIGPRDDLELRVAGSGPPTAILESLSKLPGVTVENHWVPESELGRLIAWADVLVLSHREASQSGVAAAAIGSGRWVVATRVGGIVEQLNGEKLAKLCEPNAESLAAALVGLLEAPPPSTPPADPRAAWREASRNLLADIAALNRPGALPLDPARDSVPGPQT